MKYQQTIRTSTRLLVAVLTVAALSAVVAVASRASHQATVAKRDEFMAAEQIQLAARERKGHQVATREPRP